MKIFSALIKYVFLILTVFVLVFSFKYTRVCRHDNRFSNGIIKRQSGADSTSVRFNVQLVKKAFKEFINENRTKYESPENKNIQMILKNGSGEA